MRIAVFGPGGVGGYFGAHLARAGHEVHLIGRGAHLEGVRASGLRVESPKGAFSVRPAGAASDPAAVGPVDLLLVAVKTWQLIEAAPALAPLIGPETAVLPLLNGVEAHDILAAALGQDHVLGGLCRIIAYIAAPGVIRHVGAEPTIIFGELDNRRSARVEALQTAFSEAGFGAVVPPDIHVAIWEKFMLVCTWSGLGAVTRAPLGVWLRLPGTRALAEAALREVVAVANARGVAVAPAQVEATLRFLDTLPYESTASMQRDIMEGRPSELEAQNGAVVRLGQAAGVPTPVHSFLYHALLPQELAARGALVEDG
ncbi:MAG: 2-dehydropantoate 2-reductase [Oscillochloridaceae bacterium]|nr:2-dehydropantoate 2-reductase [Chloroflexaceae bacterium]MDW8392045.1 2-dehydropantoate 2-reductase [Oscillochloridaceae bacterium]